MSRKSVFGVLAAAAAAAAALAAVKYVKDRKNIEDEDVDDVDDEVHFIEINDDEEDEESDDDEPCGPHVGDITPDEEEDEEDDTLDIHAFLKPEEGEEKEEGPIDEDVKEIAAIYPYLDPAFISDTLDRSDAFDLEFPEDTLVSAMHTVTFTDLHDVLNFEVIMADAGYICQHDASLTVRAAKRFFAEEGAVVSDILNVANQAAALHGKYAGCQLN